MWQYFFFFHWSISLPGWFQCLFLLPKILQCVVALVFCCDMKIKLWCKITIDNFYLKIIRKEQIKTNLYFSWKLNGYCHKALLYLFCIWCAYNENKPKFLALLRTLPKLISSHIDIGGGCTAPVSHRKYHFIFILSLVIIYIFQKRILELTDPWFDPVGTLVFIPSQCLTAQFYVPFKWSISENCRHSFYIINSYYLFFLLGSIYCMSPLSCLILENSNHTILVQLRVFQAHGF